MSLKNDSFRLPPFGRILEAYCAEKIHLVQPIHIYLGRDARDICLEGHRWQNMWTFLPEGQRFENFRWPVLGQHVLIYDLAVRTAEFAMLCAFHLLDYHKPKTVVIHSDYFPTQILTPFGVSTHG